jgi:hypothetical protein
LLASYLVLLLCLFIRSWQLGDAFVFGNRTHFAGRFVALLIAGNPADRWLRALVWAMRGVVVALGMLIISFALMVSAAPTCVRMSTC